MTTPNLHDFDQPADDVTRPLPHALGPEKSVLSVCLTDPQEGISTALEENLTPAHFYLPAHATLFGFLLQEFEAGAEIELISMVQKLLDRGLLDRVGGPAALTDLYTYACTTSHFRYHVGLLKDKFILRSLIQNSNETIAAAYDAPDEVADLLDRTEAAFLAIRNASVEVVEETLKTTVNACLIDLQRQMEGENEIAGISTGYDGFDSLGVTLKPGEMFVIAARPSMGKTSLMMNIVERLAIDEKRRGMVFSLEVIRKQLIRNLINSRAKFATSQLSRGYKANKGDLQRIQRAALEIAAADLLINDMGGISISQLRAIARRKHKEKPLEFIAIDYLQLMRSTSKQAANNREREIAEISAGIKNLAKELMVPIIILSQLNRGPEGRTGKNLGKPRMSDLRESGSIEQDADMIGLLYREAYYAQDEDEKAAKEGVACVEIAKNRNGPTGAVPLTFVADLMLFEDGAPVQEQPDLPKQPKSRHDLD